MNRIPYWSVFRRTHIRQPNFRHDFWSETVFPALLSTNFYTKTFFGPFCRKICVDLKIRNPYYTYHSTGRSGNETERLLKQLNSQNRQQLVGILIHWFMVVPSIRLPKFESDEFDPEPTNNNIGLDIFSTAFYSTALFFDGLCSGRLYSDKINFVGIKFVPIMVGKVYSNVAMWS